MGKIHVSHTNMTDVVCKFAFDIAAAKPNSDTKFPDKVNREPILEPVTLRRVKAKAKIIPAEPKLSLKSCLLRF